MNFPQPDQARAVEKQLSGPARVELANLRRLIKHAATGWLRDLDAEGDRCKVLLAVLEDFGSSHVQLIACDMKAWPNSHSHDQGSHYHKGHGFRVFDDQHQIFVGPQGERDMELALRRSVQRENGPSRYEKQSAWAHDVPEEGFKERGDPRNYPLGKRLIDEGLSLLGQVRLSKSTPATAVRRSTPRL